MRQTLSISLGALFLVACGGGTPAQSAADVDSNAPSDATAGATPEAAARDENDGAEKSHTARDAHGATASKLKPTATEAVMKFFIVDKEKGPIAGIVISLTGPDGKTFYTQETDSEGYAETLVAVGHEYDLVYLSLGRKDISAKLPVPDEPNLNFKFTLRYKGFAPRRAPGQTVDPGFVLDGVVFDTGKATIRPESLERLDSVYEYLVHKTSARIQISGHSDNVGKPASNKKLSEKRAQACREHLISKGINGSRIEAVGYGDEQPVAPNDTADGRQRNRRIEAKEL